MRASFSKRFGKEYDKAPGKVKTAFDRRLELFVEDKFHPLLNNHHLKGEYLGCRSINVSGDWRAVYQEADGGETAYFVALRTHSQLYG